MGTAVWPLRAVLAPTAAAPSRGLLGGLAFSACFSAAFALGHVADMLPDGRGITVLGLALVAAAAWSAVCRPVWLPLLVAAYLPFATRYPIALVPGLNMTNVLIGLGAVGCLAAVQRRGGGWAVRPFEVLLALYLAVGLLGLARAVMAAPEYSLTDHLLEYKRWASPVLVFFVVRHVVRRRREALAVASALLLSAAAVAAATWLDGYEISRADARPLGRVAGVIGQPNSLGAFLVYYGTPFLAFAAAGRGLGLRAGALFGFLFAVRAMMFTLSRGAYLALAASSAVVLLFGSPLYLVGAGAAGAAVATAPELVPDSVTSRLGHTFASEDLGEDAPSEEALDQSSAHRLELWRAGLAMARDQPWLGVGLGLFHETVGRYTADPLDEDDPTDAHNAYILTVAELGVPGLLAMLAILGWLGVDAAVVYLKRRTWVDGAIALAFLGTLTAVMVSCLFGSRFSDDNLIGPFWIWAALVRTLRAPLRVGEEA